MGRNLVPSSVLASSIHPTVYRTLIALIIWFAVAAWALFYRSNDDGLLLTMATVLLMIGLAIPLALAQVWRRHRSRLYDCPAPFAEWRNHEVQVGQSHLKGTHAMIDMLLPLAAVAVGLTAIGIVFLISTPSGGA